MALDFGIEIELLLPGQRLMTQAVGRGAAHDLTTAGVAAYFAGYDHARSEQWKIVTDASITPPEGFVGLEVVSPPMNDARLNEIDVVCRVLRDLRGRTNKTCGFHVHIGARHLSVAAMRRLAYLYIEHEDIIDGLMPPSRRKSANRYCASLKDADMRALSEAYTVRDIAGAIKRNGTPWGRGRNHILGEPSRFVKLNFTSHWKHGTVEFRQHSGTLTAEKIKRWVGFCQKLVDVAATEQPVEIPQVGLDETLQRKMRRAKKSALIYQMAARPEGVTALEMQQALGSGPTSPSIPLGRLGVPFRIEGRRDGHPIFKLEVGTRAPATLDALLDKLGMEPAESEFWRARAALFSNIVRAIGHEEEGEAA